MADLTYLNDAAVLYNLKQRYYVKLIYVSDCPLDRVHVLMMLYVSTDKGLQERLSRPGESTQIREVRRHVQFDLPE